MKSKGHIEILVRGVCVKRGQILLCQSVGAANTYLPGGHVEFRETARAALEREILEEIGVKSKVGRFLGCIEHAFRQRGRWHAEINLLFELSIPSLSPAAQPKTREEWIGFRWCPLTPASLRAAHLEPAAMIIQLLQGVSHPAGFASTPDVWKAWTGK
jgi:ADP-ribose pyrophosphatase YjhB (NUDIX family)